MGLIDEVARQGKAEDWLRGAVATVLAVGPGGRTVDLLVSGAYVPAVPCSAAYVGPAEGDVVMVLKLGSAWHVAYSLGAPPLATSQNMLTNPGLELDALATNSNPIGWVATWSVGSPPLAQVVAAPVHSGTRAWQCAMTPLTERYIVPSASIQCNPSTQVRIGCWARATGTLNAGEALVLEAWPGADQTDTTPSGPLKERLATIQPTTTWRYYEVPYVQPISAAWLKPAFGITGYGSASSSGRIITLDDMTMRYL